MDKYMVFQNRSFSFLLGKYEGDPIMLSFYDYDVQQAEQELIFFNPSKRGRYYLSDPRHLFNMNITDKTYTPEEEELLKTHITIHTTWQDFPPNKYFDNMIRLAHREQILDILAPPTILRCKSLKAKNIIYKCDKCGAYSNNVMILGHTIKCYYSYKCDCPSCFTGSTYVPVNKEYQCLSF